MIKEKEVKNSTSLPKTPTECSPLFNPDAILLIKQEDGNWKGWQEKFGKIVEVRDYGPDIVLQKLLTHDGK